MYYVYILASRRHGTLYIGVTNSLQKRLEEHRTGKGSEFVKRYGVYRLVYVETYDRAEEAIAREKQLKRWARLEDRADRARQPRMARSQRFADVVPRCRPCERRDPYRGIHRDGR
jgi:putative endonuclease